MNLAPIVPNFLDKAATETHLKFVPVGLEAYVVHLYKYISGL